MIEMEQSALWVICTPISIYMYIDCTLTLVLNSFWEMYKYICIYCNFKNTYQLLNLRALDIFCVEFQSYPLKFHKNIFPIHWKISFLYNIEILRALRFKNIMFCENFTNAKHTDSQDIDY